MKKEFIDEAINNAEKSSLINAKHGAVVIYRGKIVGRGYNKYCVESFHKINRWSIHAEVDAINNALRKISQEDIRKSTLIVVRKHISDNIKNSKNISLSAPCKNCRNYILKSGIRTCYYS